MRVERAKKVYVPVTIILEEEQDFETFRRLLQYASNQIPVSKELSMAQSLLATFVNMS